MRYPNIPPKTDPIEQINARRTQPAGAAITIAINNMSGGIGKKEDSTNEITNRTGIA